MCRCWEFRAHDRPSFEELSNDLDSMLRQMGGGGGDRVSMMSHDKRSVGYYNEAEDEQKEQHAEIQVGRLTVWLVASLHTVLEK